MKPRLLDLFSGAGGAARGYQLAGFHVTGVDVRPQSRYAGDVFIQADAMTFPLDGFDAIHASPPCKRWTKLGALHAPARHLDLLTPTRERLIASGLPWVIENVPGSPMRPDWVLCGCLFLLPGLRRQRWFETNWSGVQMQSPCNHSDVEEAVTVAGHPGGRSKRDGVHRPLLVDWKRSMGIDWMTAAELSQAIPPAYTRAIGEQLLAHLAVTA